jgi:ABC-type lipoprotein export system ATPase subunit
VVGTLGDLADEGRAVVLVTHEAQSAAAADRVLHLVEGRLRIGPEPTGPGS